MKTQIDYESARLLILAIDGKDPVTRGHSERVARYVVPLAARLGIDDPERVEALIVAALLHDVGNIAIPDSILLKRSPLTELERDAAKEHSTAGEKLVAAAGMPEIARWIRHHHERYDGSGYPDGLTGSQIPLESRIIAVVEALEALTGASSYRQRVCCTTAFDELERNAGTQFDPAVVGALGDVIMDGGLQEELPDSPAAALASARLIAAPWEPQVPRRRMSGTFPVLA
jgi:HD-GYP domain-containing protein (c-di-GMP phosphodiesterase class II)